jgi:hypothetical protein
MKAIIDEQLEEVLTKLDVWNEIILGKTHCAHCQKALGVENIGAFIPRRNDDGTRRVDFYCNEPECISALLNSN